MKQSSITSGAGARKPVIPEFPVSTNDSRGSAHKIADQPAGYSQGPAQESAPGSSRKKTGREQLLRSLLGCGKAFPGPFGDDEIELARSALDTQALALKVLYACMKDGRPAWRVLFAAGLTQRMEASPAFERAFLRAACQQPGRPYAAAMVGAYLDEMSLTGKKRLFSPASLKKKHHPANMAFYGASFTTGGSEHLLAVFEVFMRHGLPLEPVMARNADELDRVASLMHKPLLELVCSVTRSLPDHVIGCVLNKSVIPSVAISWLVDECEVPLERFANPKLLKDAKPAARAYVNARMARVKRHEELAIDESQHELSEEA